MSNSVNKFDQNKHLFYLFSLTTDIAKEPRNSDTLVHILASGQIIPKQCLVIFPHCPDAPISIINSN